MVASKKPWCATKVEGDGITAAKYHDCNPGCPGYCTANVEKRSSSTGFLVTVKENCQFPFTDDFGNTFNTCSRDGVNGKAWCRTTSGEFGYCNPGCPGYVNPRPTSRPTQRTTQRTVGRSKMAEKMSDIIYGHFQISLM